MAISIRGGASDRGRDDLDAHQRMVNHPGYKALMDTQAFDISLNRVFWTNHLELKALLDRAATDTELGMELIQNVHDDLVARTFRAEASRRLHNYVASTMSLVEHSRRIMRHRTGAIASGWEDQKAQMLAHGEVPFMIGLRVFIQHRALPLFGHSLHMDKVNTPDATWESEVELGREDLLAWKDWSAPARKFLQAQPSGIKLRPLLAKHADVVWKANDWLLQALIVDNRPAMAEVNRIVVEVNQEMLGCTFEEAEAYTLRHSAERQRPKDQVPRMDEGPQ